MIDGAAGIVIALLVAVSLGALIGAFVMIVASARAEVQRRLETIALVRALGASPQVLSFTDVQAALRAGIVDGTENPISNFVTQHMDEVQKHLTVTNHGYLGYAVIVNKRFWEGLPRQVRSGTPLVPPTSAR